MIISAAQKEMRTAYLGGFAGQLIAGIIWAIAAAIGTWGSPQLSMAVLFFASMFLFPLTQITLRLIGRPAALSKNNSLNQLAMETAFIVPIGFVLVAAATLHKENWFFPASMIIVGAHYLPFMFLYGMPQFGALASLLIVMGVGIGLYLPDYFSLGGWASAIAFLAFSLIGLLVVRKEEAS